MLWVTGCPHGTQPLCSARGSRRLPSPSPSAGCGRERGRGAPGPRLSRCAVVWGSAAAPRDAGVGSGSPGQARVSSALGAALLAGRGAFLGGGRWCWWRRSSWHSEEGQAGSRWELDPAGRCPGTAVPATSEPSSEEALLGCRELLRRGRVQTGVSGSFLLPVLERVTSGRNGQKGSFLLT